MDASLWSMDTHRWATCDGSGPLPLQHMTIFRAGLPDQWRGGYLFKPHICCHRSRGTVVAEMKEYSFSKDRDNRLVVTYEDMIAKLVGDGWTRLVETSAVVVGVMPLSKSPE